eukprot:Polyplicarium_translucidae@DN1488_c0_g1_i2.p1
MKAAVLLFVVARLASALDSTCDNLYRWNPQAVYNFNTECKTHCPDGKNPPAPPDMLPDYCRFESCSLRIAEPMTTKVVDYPTEAGCQYSCQVEAYQANFGSGSGCLGYFYDAATKKCGRHIDGEVDLSPGTTIYGPTWCKDPTEPPPTTTTTSTSTTTTTHTSTTTTTSTSTTTTTSTSTTATTSTSTTTTTSTSTTTTTHTSTTTTTSTST